MSDTKAVVETATEALESMRAGKFGRWACCRDYKSDEWGSPYCAECRNVSGDHEWMRRYDSIFNELSRADALAQRVQELGQERDDLRLELVYLTTREYDDNAAVCFDNRRALAVAVAKQLGVTPEEQMRMVAAASKHAGTGAEIIRWLVDDLRQRVQELGGENVR